MCATPSPATSMWQNSEMCNTAAACSVSRAFRQYERRLGGTEPCSWDGEGNWRPRLAIGSTRQQRDQSTTAPSGDKAEEPASMRKYTATRTETRKINGKSVLTVRLERSQDPAQAEAGTQ
ncbi:uncharacterized protein LOC105841078 [Monomorium pharaonis]|uniref:uncharacterized protein LOC105841078 n=1 Tax=Monomorium pharaonis TaxID=307658 RepID=UPI00063F7C6B|nr:uncharacterized protein LOC105841078 [Monomorium pharaonis]